jgi:hypothetical protein
MCDSRIGTWKELAFFSILLKLTFLEVTLKKLPPGNFKLELSVSNI